jgi:hypothetical protein
VPSIPSKSCGLADKNNIPFDGMKMIRNKHIPPLSTKRCLTLNHRRQRRQHMLKEISGHVLEQAQNFCLAMYDQQIIKLKMTNLFFNSLTVSVSITVTACFSFFSP